ncbi:MAG: hypothetical protein HN764_04410 [Gammaproteobacteria bacterium]|jgi:hypothetical protein|nr:hypothetical protein [Gammaproteobacteria bacterium]
MGTHTSTQTTINSFDISSFIEEHLRSPDHSWSIGISGAIGEFMYDEDEQITIEADADEIRVTTARGAMQINNVQGIKCLAYEEPSPCIKSWSQNVAFCIPESAAQTPQHSVLTELGVDQNAVVESSRGKLIFDMGVDSAILQFCVRTDDNELIRVLRENCGRPIFDSGNPASQAILDASPARVVISSLGRMEIESKIPKTPSETLVGPHTHLLPTLLASKRQGFAGIPEGYVEALTLYPEHPLFDKYGEKKAFKQSAYDEFQILLSNMGAQNYLQEKNRLNRAILENMEMDTIISGDLPWQRHAYKIAKMQAPLLKSFS